MGLFRTFFNQTRKPMGFLGAVMLNRMNAGHAKLSDWGMGQLPPLSPEQVAELGCGGGRNIAALLRRYPGAVVTGVDYSPLSVEKARKTNRRAVGEGRCTVQEGSAAALPLDADRFDLATAFETIYFWPGLEDCFREVYRVLKPGGVFLIVNESDGADAVSLKFETIIDGMKTYTPEAVEHALDAAGFVRVRHAHHENRPWIAVLAEKPEAERQAGHEEN